MKEEMKKIIRSEHDHPRQVLGPHKTVDGTVVRSYFPGAVQCEILVRGQKPVTKYARLCIPHEAARQCKR